jgi:hypothetical protein
MGAMDLAMKRSNLWAEGRGPHALGVWGACSAQRGYACLNEGAWQPWL